MMSYPEMFDISSYSHLMPDFQPCNLCGALVCKQPDMREQHLMYHERYFAMAKAIKELKGE